MAKTTGLRFPDQQSTAKAQHCRAHPRQKIGAYAAVACIPRDLQRANGQANGNQKHATAHDGLRHLGRDIRALRLVGVCVGRNLRGLCGLG